MVRTEVAEKHIAALKAMETPYDVVIKGVRFNIKDTDIYPTSKVTEMFLRYLLEERNIKGKVIADIGCATFVLGIICLKEGAKKAIGLDINKKAVSCAKEVIKRENIKNAEVMSGTIEEFSSKYKGEVDIIVAGTPWDSVSSEDDDIPEDSIERSFYDVDDKLINGIMNEARELFKDKNSGEIYITSSKRVLERVDRICKSNRMKYTIVREEDIEEGNPHYILKLSRG